MWNPHDLIHCYDSVFLAMVVVILCFLTIGLYYGIAYTWYCSFKHSPTKNKKVWASLVFIFVVGASMYLSFPIAVYYPKAAIIFRIVFLTINIVGSVYFLLLARYFKFENYGIHEEIGSSVLEINLDQLSDQEVSRLMKQLTNEAFKRIQEK